MHQGVHSCRYIFAFQCYILHSSSHISIIHNLFIFSRSDVANSPFRIGATLTASTLRLFLHQLLLTTATSHVRVREDRRLGFLGSFSSISSGASFRILYRVSSGIFPKSFWDSCKNFRTRECRAHGRALTVFFGICAHLSKVNSRVLWEFLLESSKSSFCKTSRFFLGALLVLLTETFWELFRSSFQKFYKTFAFDSDQWES